MSFNQVVIAGAGIAGIATAYELAEHHGISDVLVVDPRPPLTLTSDKSGANYREWWPDPRMVALVRRSIVIMQSLHRAGAPFTMNRRGYLYLTSDPERARDLPELSRPYQAAGITPIRVHPGGSSSDYEPASADALTGPDGADVLPASLVHRAFPHLSREVRGAIHARNAGSVDPVAMGRYLLAAGQQQGVKLITGAITGVDTSGGRVRSVTIASEGNAYRIDTGVFVNATGPFVQKIQELSGTSVPIVNVLQQKIWLPDPLGVVPPIAPFTTSLDPMDGLPAGLHIKPEAVRGRAGIKLGWAFNQVPGEPLWEPKSIATFPAVVLRGASRLVPGLDAYASKPPDDIVPTCGYYTRTPDDLPLIGPAGPEGVIVVAGLAGYGAMAACAVGEIAASWVAGTTRLDIARDFEPARFDRNQQPRQTSMAPSGAL